MEIFGKNLCLFFKFRQKKNNWRDKISQKMEKVCEGTNFYHPLESKEIKYL